MMMNSSPNPENRESRLSFRRLARLSRGRTARSVFVLAVVGLILAVVLLVGPAIAATFSDVYSDTYDNPDYPNAVAALSDLGVIGGFTDGTFRPHDPVTRQQFAKMIVKLLGIPVTGNEICPFTDVVAQQGSDPFYPSKYVAVCASHGITSGKTATSFAPNDNMTRAQLLTMVVRAARQAGILLTDPTPAYYSGTSEGSHFFSTWVDANHALNGQTAEVNGLLWGIWPAADSTWSPYLNATRGEVAQILWRLWQKIGGTSSTTLPPVTTTTLPPTTTTTRPPTTTTTAPGETLVAYDDFSSTSSGWGNFSYWSNGYYYRYENGAYVVEIDPGDTSWLLSTYSDIDISRTRVEADMTLVNGDTLSGCGLMLRCQADYNFYLFEVDKDGYYAIYRCDASDNWTRLTGWTYSPAIRTMGMANHLEFSASGNQLSAWANGSLLISVTDGTYSHGTVGFYVEALGSAAVKCVVDNLEVWQLP